MNNYPAVIDLSKYAGISDEEIKRDIADTEAEIRDLDSVRKADEIRAHSITIGEPARRIAEFTADARPHQQAERREFVAFLQRILAARERETAKVSS